MSHRAGKFGFTLIELLIVIAIIAILAAIAVPNFLEAQTRAKVARVRSDLRTLATAIECYHVDYDDYVPPDMKGYTAASSVPYGGFFAVLSTPLAYVANSYLRDPFTRNLRSGLTGWDSDVEVYYHYYGYNAHGSVQNWDYTGDGHYRGQPVFGNGANIPPGNPAYNAHIDLWVLRSLGPDGITNCLHFPQIDSTSQWYVDNGITWNGVLGRCSADPPYPAPCPNRVQEFVYEPTNGTTSAGEIFRLGGTADAGNTNDQHVCFQYLQNATNDQ